MNLFDKYNNIHPDFLERLHSLPFESAERISRKLQRENSRINFLSTISEYKFGEFLHSRGCSVVYDYKLEGKTPDWSFEINGEKAICEVKRLNADCTTLVVEELYSFIEESCSNIPSNNIVFISSDCSSNTVINNSASLIAQVNNYIEDIRNFMLSEHRRQLTIKLGHSNSFLKLVIKKLKRTTNKNSITWNFGPDSIQFDIRRAYSSDIVAKINKYRDLVTKHRIRFYIGLHVHFDTAITPEEIFHVYIGAGCKNIDTGCLSTMLGKFYTDDSYGIVDGLIIMFNGNFYLINNPRKSHQINDFLLENTVRIPSLV